MTFLVISAMAAAFLYVATNAAPIIENDLLPPRSVLALSLGAALIAFLLYVIDAERKLRTLAEQVLRQQWEQEAAREREAGHRDFVSVVAHELRSPLAAIKGFARTLVVREHDLPAEKRVHYLTLIDEQSDRLARLVGDLTEATRIESGGIRLDRDEVDLGMVIKELADGFRGKWSDRPLVLDVPDDLSPVAYADRRRLEEILINLIDNACKYTPPGHPVEVSVRRVDGSLSVSVRDHGPGIPEEERARIFEKFHRIDTASGIEGSGLGLYIVRGLVEAHGGTVTIHDAPGGGARFVFSLPVAAVAA
ncbi:MAG TPA: ATP-binding protein [Actinomycetota bacterium]|nr:ATP-binding protein [Actinomycetota bacterium]